MVRRRVDQAVEAMSGRLIAGDPEAMWSGVTLDSRQVRGGELFFALVGEATDGHRFVDQALERGATGAVVHEVPAVLHSKSAVLIQVGDPYDALHSLTRAVRNELPKTLIGITGSAGKTTVKELLASMLAAKFATAKSPGNLNNLFGFPVALLGIDDDAEVMVAEMGMSTPDELRQVSELGRPDLVVLLNVRAVHLANFDSLESIADAKAEILEGLAPGGAIVANGDDELVVKVVQRFLDRCAEKGQPKPTVRWFALAEAAQVGSIVPDIWAEAIRLPSDADGGLKPSYGSRFRLMTHPARCDVDLPLIGRFNVANFLAAATVAHHLGVPLEVIAQSVAAAKPAEHRGAVLRVPNGPVIIDDSYNSNPDALAQALESVAAMAPADACKVAILGDMLELGPDEERFHREAGQHAAGLGFEPIVGVGKLASGLAVAAGEEGAISLAFDQANEAAAWALKTLGQGDLVLVKGSRGVGLETVVEALVGSDRQETHQNAQREAVPGGSN